MKRMTYRGAPAHVRGVIRQAADRWQTTDGVPLGELLDGEVPVGTDALEYTVCDTCWSYEEPHILTANGGVCETCRLEPPTGEACPDCRAEVGVPCTWACSSRWT